jgi:hypothetical protein
MLVIMSGVRFLSILIMVPRVLLEVELVDSYVVTLTTAEWVSRG